MPAVRVLLSNLVPVLALMPIPHKKIHNADGLFMQ
jgi:hypothetical protein